MTLHAALLFFWGRFAGLVVALAVAPAAADVPTDAQPRFAIHLTPAEGDPCAALDRQFITGDLVSRGNSAVDQFAIVLVTGLPQFIGAQFGIEYGSDVTVREWHPCWDTIEIAAAGFPRSGGGMAQLWGNCLNMADDEWIPIGLFEIEAGSWGSLRTTWYSPKDPATVETCDRPAQVYEVLMSDEHGTATVHDPFALGWTFSRF